MNGFKKRHGKAPTWFSALGHDAAVLAKVAIRVPPTTRASDLPEVQERHESARAGLADAETDLWSTGARGFSRENTIARPIGVVEVK